MLFIMFVDGLLLGLLLYYSVTLSAKEKVNPEWGNLRLPLAFAWVFWLGAMGLTFSMWSAR